MAKTIRRLRNQLAALARFYRAWKGLGAEGCPDELERLMPLCDRMIAELDAEKPDSAYPQDK
jgi:hypothetical protein